MSANVSVSLLPSAYTNVTLSSPIEQQAVTVCPDATALPFRASLLTLGNRKARSPLLSLNRSLQIADDVHAHVGLRQVLAHQSAARHTVAL